MSIVCFGLNHQSAPISVLERVSLPKPRMEEFLGTLRKEPVIQEVAGLSTCNRTEFYFVSPEPVRGRECVLNALLHQGRVDGLFVPGEHTYTHRNENAARHLFRVAAGVDSLIVGEAQILGQIRGAYELAMNVGSVGGMLNALIMRAISLGRKVRTRTNIGKGNVSVASVAVRVARDTFGDLAGKRLLTIGAGETAQLATRPFCKQDLGSITILNRTEENARAFVEEVGGRFLSIEEMTTALAEADIVVVAAGAPHHIVTRRGLEQILASRGGRPILLVDLSLPRNVDPAVATLPGVSLSTLADLEAIAAENRDQRVAEISEVEQLIEQETNSFLRHIHTAETTRLVTLLRRRVEETRRRHLGKHAHHFSEDQLNQLERYTDSLLRSILHDVTVSIRSIDPATDEGAGQFQSVLRLFHIDPSELHD